MTAAKPAAKPGSIPEQVTELDASWLSEALSARYPEARVASVELVAQSQATNAHARL